MAELNEIRAGALDQVSTTKKLGQESGAGILGSETGQAAMAVRERLEGVKKQGAANIEAARAASTEQAGTAQNQQGNTQVQIGQTMMAAAPIMATTGLGAIPSLSTFVAGAAMVATGQGNQAQGEQKVAEAPPMMTKSSDLGNQSAGHFDKAEQIERESEEQANTEDPSDPNSPKETGKNKGYYVGDSGNAGASTDTDDELVADRLTDGEEAINAKLGITDTKEGSIATDDQTTIASQLNEITDNINGLTDTKEGSIATDDQTTIASQLKAGAQEVDSLLGLEKEKVA
jgi:hypothetical protein